MLGSFLEGAIRQLGAITLAILAGSCTGPAWSQEIEPRAYWPAPTGINSASVGYSFSVGDNVTDPTLPLENAASKLQSVQVAYYTALELLGRSANFTVSGPYFWGKAKGEVEATPVERQVSGLADPNFRFAINLRGGPAMGVKEFQEFRQNPKTLVGASVRVQPPLGQYDPNLLVNLGTNRWAIKPQIGVVYPAHRRWLLEFYLGGWFFTDNNEFQGSTRSQDPVAAAEFHLIHRFRAGFWASLDSTLYYGGRTYVDGSERANLQRNYRLGGTVVIPVSGGHVLKFSVSSGVWVAHGGDYETVAASYQYVWRRR